MSSFDNIALAYDQSIDWDSRISREIPFILEGLTDVSSLEVLDMACGSGRHSVALSSRGAKVTGFDNSEVMIEASNQLALSQNLNVEFFISDMLGFTESIGKQFDIVMCLGNSLALLPNFEALISVLSEVRSILKPNGQFIFQVLNFEEIISTGFSMFPLKRGRTSSGNEVRFVRFFDHNEGIEFTTLVLTSILKSGNDWETVVSTQNVLKLDAQKISQALESSGFEKFEFFGGYDKRPLTRKNDRSIVVRATK